MSFTTHITKDDIDAVFFDENNLEKAEELKRRLKEEIRLLKQRKINGDYVDDVLAQTCGLLEYALRYFYYYYYMHSPTNIHLHHFISVEFKCSTQEHPSPSTKYTPPSTNYFEQKAVELFPHIFVAIADEQEKQDLLFCVKVMSGDALSIQTLNSLPLEVQRDGWMKVFKILYNNYEARYKGTLKHMTEELQEHGPTTEVIVEKAVEEMVKMIEEDQGYKLVTLEEKYDLEFERDKERRTMESYGLLRRKKALDNKRVQLQRVEFDMEELFAKKCKLEARIVCILCLTPLF